MKHQAGRLLLLVLSLSACKSSSQGSSSIADAAPVAAPDAAVDVAPDVAPDLAPDVAPDVAPDLAPDVAPDVAPDLDNRALPLADGFTLQECENPDIGGMACGTWVWSASRNVFVAIWNQNQNAPADIKILENTPSRVVFDRFDPARGGNAELRADYVGMVVGERKLAGTVMWRSTAGNGTGKWTATW